MTTPSPPPGTGETLIEELEQAAEVVRAASFLPDGSVSDKNKALASRLRARAARVRELGEALEADRAKEVAASKAQLFARAAPFLNGRLLMFGALAGPLSPTEPAATPTRDERRWTGRHHWEALPGTGWQCSCGSLRRVYGTNEQTEYRTPPARNWTSQEPPCGAGRAATRPEKGGQR